MNSTPYREYLEPCCAIAKKAGDIILQHPARLHGFEVKTDPKTGRQSKVTTADMLANKFIVEELQKLTPGIPVIAEEDTEEKIKARPRIVNGTFWLVDPLDGTSSFVRGEREYTVNIALIAHNTPLLGVIYSPGDDQLYYGCSDLVGKTAYRINNASSGGQPEPIHVRKPPPEGLTVTRSRSSHTEGAKQLVASLHVKNEVESSSSIKFCRIAEGAADIYPRFGRTMEWDTAAGHAILTAAGGQVEQLDGSDLSYGKPDFANPPFLATSVPYSEVLKKAKNRDRGRPATSSFPGMG